MEIQNKIIIIVNKTIIEFNITPAIAKPLFLVDFNPKIDRIKPIIGTKKVKTKPTIANVSELDSPSDDFLLSSLISDVEE